MLKRGYKPAQQKPAQRSYFAPRANWGDAKFTDRGLMSLEQVSAYIQAPDHLKNLAVVGDTDTLGKYLAGRQMTTLQAPAQLYENYAVAGDFVDVGRYMSGEPECMVSYFVDEQPAKLCTVTVRVCRPGLCSDRKVFHYYGMVLDAIDTLETSGTRCQVNLEFRQYWQRSYGGEINLLTVPFKSHSEPLNMASFAGAVLNNKFQTRLYEAYSYWGMAPAVDYYAEYTHSQTREHITFPSLYYKGYFTRHENSYNIEEYLTDIDLGHLLDA